MARPLTPAGSQPWTGDPAQWTPARDLTIGSWLRATDGTWTQVETVTHHQATTNTRNLTIAGTHTYYVTDGKTNTLAHNCNVNWSAVSGKTFGHTFSKHGVGKKNTRRLMEIARQTGRPMGQFVNNDRVATILKSLYSHSSLVLGEGVTVVTLRAGGIGRMFMPNGSTVNANYLRVVFKSAEDRANGNLIRTAFPCLTREC